MSPSCFSLLATLSSSCTSASVVVTVHKRRASVVGSRGPLFPASYRHSVHSSLSSASSIAVTASRCSRVLPQRLLPPLLRGQLPPSSDHAMTPSWRVGRPRTLSLLLLFVPATWLAERPSFVDLVLHACFCRLVLFVEEFFTPYRALSSVNYRANSTSRGQWCLFLIVHVYAKSPTVATASTPHIY